MRENVTYRFETDAFQSYNLVNKGDGEDHIIVLAPYEVRNLINGKEVKTMEISGVEVNYFVEEYNRYMDTVTMYIESEIEEGICISLSRSYKKSDYSTGEEMVEEFQKIMEELIKK